MKRPLHSPKAFRNAVLIGVLAGVVSALLPLATYAQMPVIRFVRDPDTAPDFKAKDLTGKELSLEPYKGKVVLLNFWATWCGPCRMEIPSLVELQNRYKEHLQIIGMDVDDDDAETVRDVVKNESINYPVAITSGEVRMAYGGIAALPTLFVINAEGKVVQKHVGLYNPALYETEVRALLGLPIAAKVETFEDTGEVFLKHADRATMLPGVDMSKLTPEQRMVVLHKLNAEGCDCGCKFTLAQCRIYDRGCSVSSGRAAAILKEAAGVPAKDAPDKPTAQPPAADPSVSNAPDAGKTAGGAEPPRP
jgi:thiol-disulfide isomerase/thioredoxin